jgi:hypothetical protein
MRPASTAAAAATTAARTTTEAGRGHGHAAATIPARTTTEAGDAADADDDSGAADRTDQRRMAARR